MICFSFLAWRLSIESYAFICCCERTMVFSFIINCKCCGGKKLFSFQFCDDLPVQSGAEGREKAMSLRSVLIGRGGHHVIIFFPIFFSRNLFLQAPLIFVFALSLSFSISIFNKTNDFFSVFFFLLSFCSSRLVFLLGHLLRPSSIYHLCYLSPVLLLTCLSTSSSSDC